VTAPPPGKPAPPRRWPRLKPSRFELQIALALVLAAVVPLSAALWLASRLAEENLSLGLNPRVVDRLEATPALYRDLFQARKQLYAEQARALARGLPRAAAAAAAAAQKEFLEAAVRHTPRLRRVALLDAEGNAVAEAENPDPNPEGEWREALAGARLPDGRTLECVFAIEARFFAELDEARELAEGMQGVEALRADIQRSYVRAFAIILGLWALAAGLAGWWLARRTTRRVSELVAAVGELARGNLQVQVRVGPGTSADEVGQLARAFNAMVTEVREGRDRIVYLEKISGWQEVARRLAHEIKNPLTPIQLAFQQLEAKHRGLADPDPAFARLLADAGEIVREEIGTLQRLVEEFSGFAKLPEVRPEPADLGEFVEEFLKQSPQLTEAADLVVARAPGPVPVGLDRALMRRVLANLVQNAIEAAKPARARVHVAVAREGGRAVLSVADEGPGIAPEARDRVFDPYFTTKQEGTGLGLAIVKKIVLQHGGDISVGERPGGGARFSVVLPGL
jgi:nitrogen fixation/metabolism regulation signal transduction histidine kinase